MSDPISVVNENTAYSGGTRIPTSQLNGSDSGQQQKDQGGYEDVPGTNYTRPWQYVAQTDANGNTSYVKAYGNPIPKVKADGSSGSGRNDALTAAMDALNGYLQASSLASARQKDAFDVFDKLSQYALPPGATTAPGYEAGGPAQAFAAQIGLKNYTPPPIQAMQVNPAALAQEPAISPAVQAMLGAISGAGGNAAAQAAAR